MSYTLSGRLQSRLLAAVPVLLLAAGWAWLAAVWWPVQVALLMLAVALLLDGAVYHRLLPYQPGWAAVPMGLLELAAVLTAVRLLAVPAPTWPALGLFGAGWVSAQVLGQAVLPVARLTYAEDGGELGRLAAVALVVPLLVAGGAGGVFLATRPPTVHLAGGVHQGPLVLDHPVHLLGEPGAVVRGGIVVRSSHVLVRDVTVQGGENGIVVDGPAGGVSDVRLEQVHVAGASLDGIHVRRAQVSISGCTVDALGNPYGQGIDISFGADLPMSMVEGCTVTGGREGIVTHFVHVMVKDNVVSRTTLRAISLTEMSMGMAEGNHVMDVLGVGILCGDHSMCELTGNGVVGAHPDAASGDRWRMGYGVLVQMGSEATLRDNHLVDCPGGVGHFLGGRVSRS